MTAQLKNTVGEVVRSVVVAAILTAGSAVALAYRLEERVKANKEEAQRELAAAVAVRRAEVRADVESRVVPLESAFRAQSDVLRELVSLAKDGAKGNEQLLVRFAKIEGKVDALNEKLDDHIRK